MRLSPPEPSFLEMRDAILEASPDEDDDLLWQVFASRGMGYLASTDMSTDETPVADSTIPPPLSVSTGAVEVGSTTAKLTGIVTPHGGPTHVQFEYGLSNEPYDRTAPSTPLELPGSMTAKPVSIDVSDLQPLTTYHFRVVATRGGQRVESGDATFVTAAAPPPPDSGGGGGGTGDGGGGGGGSGTNTTPPPTTSTPPPAVIQLPPVVVTTQLDTKLTANRKGYFKVKTLFGATAPAGIARFVVKSRGRRLASSSTSVRQGRTVTKTVRLSRKGRRVIKPGRSKRVKLQTKLPSGETMVKTLRLTRARR
jgi:hypothetical protein